MPKCFDAVYQQHRYLVTVTRRQFGVLLNVDFFQRVEVVTSGGAHLLFHFITEVAAGFCIQDYACFHFESSLPNFCRASEIPLTIRLPTLPRKMYKGASIGTFYYSFVATALLVNKANRFLHRHQSLCHG